MNYQGDPFELAGRIATLRRLLEESGRSGAAMRIYAGMPIFSFDQARRFEELGVTDLSVGYRNLYEPDRLSLQAKCDWIERFGDEVIARSAT